MRKIILLTTIVGVALALLRSASFVAFCTTVVLWGLAIVVTLMKAFLSRPRMPMLTFAVCMIAYASFAVAPDTQGFSPRMISHDWPTTTIRESYGPITRLRFDFARQSFRKADDGNIMATKTLSGESNTVAVSHEVSTPDPFADTAPITLSRRRERHSNDPNDAEAEFEELISIIDATVGRIGADDDHVLGPGHNLPYPPGFRSYISEWRPSESLRNFMWIGHLFMSIAMGSCAYKLVRIGSQCTRRNNERGGR